jgi:hypothetical protein
MKLYRVVRVVTLLAVACTAVTPPDGNGNNSGTLTPEKRIAALDAINATAFALTGASVDERRQELLTYLLSRPEIATAGESEDGSAMVVPLANDFNLTADQRVLPVSPSPVLSWPTLTPTHKPKDSTPR